MAIPISCITSLVSPSNSSSIDWSCRSSYPEDTRQRKTRISEKVP